MHTSTRAQILRSYRQRTVQSGLWAVLMAALSLASFIAVSAKVTHDPLELTLMFVGGVTMAVLCLLALMDASEWSAKLAQAKAGH